MIRRWLRARHAARVERARIASLSLPDLAEELRDLRRIVRDEARQQQQRRTEE